jgi:hypothetical protein
MLSPAAAGDDAQRQRACAPRLRGFGLLTRQLAEAAIKKPNQIGATRPSFVINHDR